MSRMTRILFYGVVAALWLLLIGISLEMWPRLHWRIIEKRNPYLLSRTERLSWPTSAEHPNEITPFLLDKAERERYRGSGKSAAQLSPVSPRQEMAQRAAFFFTHDDPERYLFANVYGLHIFLLRGDGSLIASCSVNDYDGNATLSDYVDEADAPLILNAMAEQANWEDDICFVTPTGTEHPSPFGYCLALPQRTEEAQDAWLMFRRKDAVTHIPDDSLWELPFMTYKKHVTRQDRVGVLGIAEDYYINNHGFRDWDIILPKPDGVFRIVCVGASTTEEGVTNELTYPAMLETLLNRHFDGNSVDVVNCGISGMNSMKHRMRLPDYLALEPDMIMFYVAVNDISHQLLPRWVSEATPKQQKLRQSRFITHYMNHCLLPPEEQMRQAIALHVMPNLRYIIQEASQRGIITAVGSFAAPATEHLSSEERAYYNYLTMKDWGGRYVTFDSYLRILALYNDALRQLCAEENALYVPVAEELQGGALFFGDICHLRNPGIQRKAEIIAETLIPWLDNAIVDR